MNRKQLPDLSVADLHENLVGDYRMGKTQSTHSTHPFVRDFVLKHHKQAIAHHGIPRNLH